MHRRQGILARVGRIDTPVYPNGNGDREPSDIDSQILRQAEFRRVLRHFAAHVTIVTVRLGDALHGMTATAVCRISVTPPLLLVCISKHAFTHNLISVSGIFAVNLLHQGQRELAERFAGRCPELVDRFAGVAYHHEVTGAPILDDSLGYFDCRLVASHDGGDHTIFVGQVEAVGQLHIKCALIYHQSKYVDLPMPELAD